MSVITNRPYQKATRESQSRQVNQLQGTSLRTQFSKFILVLLPAALVGLMFLSVTNGFLFFRELLTCSVIILCILLIHLGSSK